MGLVGSTAAAAATSTATATGEGGAAVIAPATGRSTYSRVAMAMRRRLGRMFCRCLEIWWLLVWLSVKRTGGKWVVAISYICLGCFWN